MSADLQTQLGLVPEATYAKMRDVDIRALQNERAKGLGPPFVKDGRAVFYPLAQLRKYIAKQARAPSKTKTLVNGGNRKRGARSENQAA
jgi:hypothetical protein